MTLTEIESEVKRDYLLWLTDHFDVVLCLVFDLVRDPLHLGVYPPLTLQTPVHLQVMLQLPIPLG